ncbi:MAG: hypothetical protein FJ179_09615, partial [Gammaproteobacteria bacterium]|nr:hypothetical protein [Gammaproteobacteria bacterium]
MTRRFSLLVVATLIVLLTGAAGSASAQILPTDYPKMKMSLQSSPRGAPNVVVVLLDDVGFAAA